MLSKAALRSLLLVSLLGLFIASPANLTLAEFSNAWTSIGPEGGNIQTLAIDPVTPATLYAGTMGGVFKSTNGGGAWSAVNAGLTDTYIFSLAIDPVTPTTLYVGASANNVFKSTNGGETWSVVDTGLTSSMIHALAIDPVTPTTLYAGSGGGVFKSTNGGAIWNEASVGLTSIYISALVIDPITPTTLYVGTLGGGVFKSTNGGGTWSAIGLTNTSINALAINPETPTTLYVGTSGGVFKSENGGGTWSVINIGLTITNVRSLAIDPATPTTLYAGIWNGGVFKSTNNGGTWNAINIGLTAPNVIALAIDPAMPTALYAGTYFGGVFKSTSGGGDWNAVNTGLTNTIVSALAIDPATPTTLYVGTSGGSVLKSTNGGGDWNAINVDLPKTNGIGALAVDPATPTTLYAGTSGGGVFKSTNGGDIWIAVNTSLTNTSVSTLAIDPVTPTTLYAGTSGGGVFKSTNGGGIWVNTGLTATVVRILAIDPKTPTTLYAGTNGGGVFKSTDGGETWGAINTGLDDRFVYALAIELATPTILYAGTNGGGVFKSTDGGATWNAINTGLFVASIEALAIDPATPTTLYAGTNGGSVFKSTDGGATWNAINTGLFVASIEALAIDPATPTTLYAGTNGGGVFVLRQKSVLLVNTPNDFVDPVPGDGICGAGGACSLRAAIMEANTLPGQDSISVPAGDYALTLGGLTVTDTVRLNGAGQDQTIIRGNAAITTSPVVLLSASANLANLTIRDGAGGGVAVDSFIYGGNTNVWLDHVTVSNNTRNGGGGGITLGMVSGNLTLNHSRVISNTAGRWMNGGGYGGGIQVANFSELIVNDSVIAGNTSTGSGGGIAIFSGAVDFSSGTIANSTIANNSALENGGGVWQGEGGVVHLVNSTVSGNSASYGGGLISQLYGQIEITNTTIANNSARVAGGGLATMQVTFTQSLTQVQVYPAGVISLTNTLVADNLAPTGADCYRDTGQLISRGHNLIGSTAGCVITSTATDPVNISALLGPLQANSGDTLTHALLPGSPAINAGDNAACPATDQRGVPRPYGPACDIGAYESGDTFQVGTTLDLIDPVPGDGECGVGGSCSLRAAIMESNARPGQDSISIPAGDYALTLGGLTISDTIQLNGAGQDQTILRGSAAITTSPVVLLTVSAKLANLTIRDGAGGGVAVDSRMQGADVEFDRVTVSNNTNNRPGGGIILWAIGNNLTLNHSQVISNTAAGGGYGGGINVGDYSAVILNDSVVAGNTATGGGGGVASIGGWININNSTIADNTALEDGGGVLMRQGYGSLRLVNSTVSGNSASYGGGLVSEIDGRIEITNTTIANNSARVAGGGLATTPVTFTQSITQIQITPAGVISLTNTLVADNLAPTGADCYRDTGQLISRGHNLIGTTAGCVITSMATDLVNISALLGPLQANSGDTLTHALLPGSPAINAGDNAACPATDQRGVIRPHGPACDIGAYEWVNALLDKVVYLPLITRNYTALSAQFEAVPLSGTASLTVTFANTSQGAYTNSLWDFGDGLTSTVISPTHVYSQTGRYTVTLTVSNTAETATLSRTNYITVTNVPTLTVDFWATPLSGVVPLTVTFTNLTPGTLMGSLWDFGDNTGSTQHNPIHSYTTPGTYTVTLSVTTTTWSGILIRLNYITVTTGMSQASQSGPVAFGIFNDGDFRHKHAAMYVDDVSLMTVPAAFKVVQRDYPH